MTIGVGFRCRDAIVLCADTQPAWPQSHQDSERTIYDHYGDAGEWAVAFTLAGSPTLMRSFDAKFSEMMQIAPTPKTASTIQDVIETALSLHDTLDTDPSGLSLLCAIVIPQQEMRFLKIEGKVVAPAHSFDYVGIGDSSLLRYLRPILINSEADLTTQQAFTLGSYLVLQAKRYIKGCGGETDMIALYPEGRLMEKFSGTHNTEHSMLNLERDIGSAVQAVFDPSVKDVELDRRLAILYDRIRRVKLRSA